MAITRATNLAGLGTVFDALTDGGGLSISGVSTFTDLNVTRANVTGVSTAAQLNVGTGGTVITTTDAGLVGVRTDNPITQLFITTDDSQNNISIRNNYPFYGGSNYYSGNLQLRTNPGYNARGLVSRLEMSTGDGAQTYLESEARSTDGTQADFKILTRNSSTPDEKLRVTYDGKVGIGTTLPAENIHIVSASDATIRLQDNDNPNTYGDISHNSGITKIISRNGNGDGVIEFKKYDGTTEDLSVIIDSSGRVAIGTDAAVSSVDLLTLANDAEVRLCLREDGGNSMFLYQQAAASYLLADGALNLYSGGRNYLKIDSGYITDPKPEESGYGYRRYTHSTDTMLLSTSNKWIRVAQLFGNGCNLEFTLRYSYSSTNTIVYAKFKSGNYVSYGQGEGLITGNNAGYQADSIRIATNAGIAYLEVNFQAGSAVTVDILDSVITGTGFYGLEYTDGSSDTLSSYLYSPATSRIYNYLDSGTRYYRNDNNEVTMIVDSEGGTTMGYAQEASDQMLFITNISDYFGFRVGASNNNWSSAYYGGSSTAASVVNVGKDSSTSRSINAGGTVNASGTDYAEYMEKENTDIIISKGDICGITTEGKLTNLYSQSISFIVKSTDPSYVGGDTWTYDLPEKPEKPSKSDYETKSEAELATLTWYSERPEPIGMSTEAYDDLYADWQASEPDLVGLSTVSEYDNAISQWNLDFSEWMVLHEAQREKFDRVAFSGQVPVNVYGSVPGQYIIPQETDDGFITGIAKSESDLTMSEYFKSVGKVIAIEDDGRAKIIVKVC